MQDCLEVVLIAKRKIWKIAVAVFVIMLAGIIYCTVFAEEREDTVQYQSEEAAVGDVGESADSVEKNIMQTGNGVVPDMGRTDVGAQVETLIYVHVCGAVEKPAVYSLPAGSRVCDAIAMAGGLTEHAADDYVNQARLVSDGERVYIPEKDELSDLSAVQYAAGQSVSVIAGSQNGNSEQTGNPVTFPVNINTAGMSELTALPGIGESRAQSIIAYREMHGAFSRIEDIMNISGIKGAAYEKIKDRICVGNE